MPALLRACRLAIRAFLVCAPLMLLIILLTGGTVGKIVAALASGSRETVAMLAMLGVPSTIAAVLAFLFALIPTHHGQPRSGAVVGAWAGGLTPLCVLGLFVLMEWMQRGPRMFDNPFPSFVILPTLSLMVIGVLLGLIFGAGHDRRHP